MISTLLTPARYRAYDKSAHANFAYCTHRVSLKCRADPLSAILSYLNDYATYFF
jgi:hypothetical protein